ncbi:hypothetical protein NIES267_73790 (plasmid) [Calothrix parasitica NIES-267]|uniref:Uncharacterized protein n=1 Tax=Calothrix parasitica NIES-267 TaxID=1973488 RepID=A0A1Z4M330_9CYAN|nr:hypothetical protein NIES267_73790 [Calothrix parasitica NIES-267]
MFESINYNNPSDYFLDIPLTEEELQQGYNYPIFVHYYCSEEESKPFPKPFQEYRPYPEPDWERYKRLRQKEAVTLPKDIVSMASDARLNLPLFTFWYNYSERYEYYDTYFKKWAERDNERDRIENQTRCMCLNKVHKIWGIYEDISSQELIPFIEALPEQKFYLSPRSPSAILRANTKADMIFFLLNFGKELNDVTSFRNQLGGDYYSTISLREPAGSAYILAEDSKELIVFPLLNS